jgi:hypothetical protein
MLPYSFVLATGRDTDPLKIALHNMKCADEMLNLEIFIGASNGWLKCNPSKNYKDLEQELRRHNFNTHLIASEYKIDDPDRFDDSISEFCGKSKKPIYSYKCIFSCKPKQYALAEVLTHSSSYEENLEKLNETSLEIIYENISYLKKDLDMSLINKLSKNIIKCVINSKQCIDDEMTKLRKDGHDPILSLCGMTRGCGGGAPIFGIMVNGKLASDMGIITEVDYDGQISSKIVKLSLTD